MSEDTALSEAKQVLLSALDSITDIEQEMDAEVRHVAVVYSVHKRTEDGSIHEQGGWLHAMGQSAHGRGVTHELQPLSAQR